MEPEGIDPKTVARGFILLYRWWIQSELRIVPEAYVRQGTDSTVVCSAWTLVGSPSTVKAAELARLKSDLGKPVYSFCRDLPPQVHGWDICSNRCTEIPKEIETLKGLLVRHQRLLSGLAEGNPERNEWLKTRDSGTFAIWRNPKAHRLILKPSNGERYGYRVLTNEDDYFLYRSRSCREEGEMIRFGSYKVSDHSLASGRRILNLDLLFSGNQVLLLHLQPAGAGYKTFARRVPGYQGSLG